MKKKFYLLFVATLCAFFIANFVVQPSFIVSADGQHFNKLTIYGNSEIKVLADEAVVNFGVQTLNTDLEIAQKENSAIISNLIEILKEFNIEEKNIRTTNYYINEKYDYSGDKETKTNQVSNFLEFRTSDLENLNNLITILCENGANVFNGINFCLSDYSKEYNKALSLAIDNAKEKLESLNEDINSYKISEIFEEQCYNNFACYVNGAKANDFKNFIEQGEITIKACVKVIFEVL